MTGRVSVVLASPRVRAWLRAAVGIVILVAIALQVGAEPFLTGLAAISPPTVAAAVALGAVATVAAAWRWRLLARRLGLQLGWTRAVAAYYRSQLLNSILPGGVVGDVHRAAWHGRHGDLGPAVRAVAAERTAGQAVQLALAAAVFATLGWWSVAPAAGAVLLLVAVAGAVVAVAAAASVHARTVVRRELGHVRVMFGTFGTLAQVTVASVLALACLVAMFAIACVAVGVDAAPYRIVAVSLIAVLAAAIPLGIGGWGPREAAAAWAFTAVGLEATAGIAASTAFGVLALLAVAPGAAVIAASALRRRSAAPSGAPHPSAEAAER